MPAYTCMALFVLLTSYISSSTHSIDHISQDFEGNKPAYLQTITVEGLTSRARYARIPPIQRDISSALPHTHHILLYTSFLIMW